MPSVNFSISRLGAVVDVQIGVSEPRRMALAQAQQPIPAPVACRLLIDTGGDDPGLAKAAKRQKVVFIPVHPALKPKNLIVELLFTPP